VDRLKGPELPNQIPPDQELAPVTVDGAFDTRKCHDVAATILPRNNANLKTDSSGAVTHDEALHGSRRFDRAIRERSSGDRRIGRAGTETHCMKLPGQFLTASDFLAHPGATTIEWLLQSFANRAPPRHVLQ
jgi:hypothetical protein